MDKEILKYVLESSNNLLKETLETSKSLNGRALNIIRFGIPIFIGLLVYIINELSSCYVNWGLLGIALLSEIIIITTFYLCYQAYHLYQVYPPGTTPTELKYPNIDNIETVLMQEIESCEQRIKWNEYVNQRMAVMINWVLRLIGWAFPIIIFLLALTFLL